jgi:excisionase family DNA binding protein
MSGKLVTVDEAAEQLSMHPKTVLRYIRDGRLQATRIGKSYRITEAALSALARGANETAGVTMRARATCVIDIPEISLEASERVAMLLNSAAITRDADAAPLHLETVFDPLTRTMKIVVIGRPTDTAKMLDMLQLRLDSRP